jgi:hypothetical protein
LACSDEHAKEGLAQTMSTHATLGIKFPDGEISGCYVHYDGGSMSPRIVDFLEKYTTTGLAVLIAEAQSCGGIRSFHTPNVSIDQDPVVRETGLLDDDIPYVITAGNWDDDHMGTSYKYLIDYETGTVWASTPDGRG